MFSSRHQLVFCVVGFAACAIGCSSSSSSPGVDGGAAAGAGGANKDGGGSVATGPAAACPNGALKIAFDPMYSAYDGVHTFQIPAIVDGLDASAVTWSASDPSKVDLAPDATFGGVMITTRSSGTVTIVATAGELCGTSLLTITSATPDDWSVGSARYNDGVVLRGLRPAGAPDAGRRAGPQDAAPPQEAACTNCHGDTANGPFKTVAHTPEQIGGFSDDELKNIFTNAVVPDGGYFDTMIVAYRTWQGFHKWEMTDDEAKGMIIYLRSLTPAPQKGAANFGGRMPGDGGPPRGGDGGIRRGDAGRG
jgi:cytochrome c553